jgi:hypothetical protein
MLVSPFPDDRIGYAPRLDPRSLVNAVEQLEYVSALFFLCDLQQIESFSHGFATPFQIEPFR